MDSLLTESKGKMESGMEAAGIVLMQESVGKNSASQSHK